MVSDNDKQNVLFSKIILIINYVAFKINVINNYTLSQKRMSISTHLSPKDSYYWPVTKLNNVTN